ncbi:MAG: hypothetical protein WBL70_17095 [Candidatus Acidiferrales bacterium]
MKRKYWWVFGVIQVLGTLAAVEAYYLEDPILWLVSLLLLLPGSLDSLPVLTHSHFGANWSLWGLCAMAVTANVLLFTVASLLRARHRKPN